MRFNILKHVRNVPLLLDHIFQKRTQGISACTHRFSSSDSNGDTQKVEIPFRVLKRLKAQGLSEDDVASVIVPRKQKVLDTEINEEMDNNMDLPRKFKSRSDTQAHPQDFSSERQQTEYDNRSDPQFSDTRQHRDRMYDFSSERQPTKFGNQTDPQIRDTPREQRDRTYDFPSDETERKQERYAFRPKCDPTLTSIVLFPGQGSQFVEMGSKLLEYDGVREIYDTASDILGYNLLDVCLNGPKSKLDKTVVCQPAVFVTSIAALEVLKVKYPQAIDNCIGTAGFSVGEYASLVFSEMVSFEDALRVVQVRAEAMQKASEETASGMMSVFTGHKTKLNFAMLAAREYCERKTDVEKAVCGIANYLYPDCKVIAGNEEALQFIEDNKEEFGIRRIKRLPVSGAFHTTLMASAQFPVVEALKQIKINKPKFRVHSNVTIKSYRKPWDVIDLLGKQIVKPVRWEQILHSLYTRQQGAEFPSTYEVGPGRQMGTLLKMINAKSYKTYKNIEV